MEGVGGVEGECGRQGPGEQVVVKVQRLKGRDAGDPRRQSASEAVPCKTAGGAQLSGAGAQPEAES